MEKLPYDSYEEVMNNFSWDDAWTLVDGNRDDINTTHECIDRHRGNGEAVRIKFEDGSTAGYTFSEISRGAAQFAHMLEDQGIERGKHVTMMLNPSYEFLVSFFGTMSRGAISVPCSELFGPEGLRYRLESSKPSLLVASRDVLNKVDTTLVEDTLEKSAVRSLLDKYPTEYDPETSAEDPAWIQHTSGTTGKPDPYTYHHKSTVYWGPQMEFTLDYQEGDSAFTTASTGWGAGIWDGLYSPLLFGIPTGFRSGPFDASNVLEAFREFDVNAIPISMPTAFRKLIDAAEELDEVPQMDKINVGGEPLDERLSREIEDVFGAFPRQRYGATELRSLVSLDYAYSDYEPKHGSMGKPIPGIDVRVVDESGAELPPNQVGYLEVKLGDEWERSGDAVYIDKEGYLWSEGRMDDTIISAGYTIGPVEIEETLVEHDAIEAAGVIGVPDDERGEIVKAFVVSTEEADDGLKSNIQNYVRERLSKHEYPREIEFIDDMPTTPDGKPKRAELREIEGLA
jgi:acetyl-CoA synthetase